MIVLTGFFWRPWVIGVASLLALGGCASVQPVPEKAGRAGADNDRVERAHAVFCASGWLCGAAFVKASSARQFAVTRCTAG